MSSSTHFVHRMMRRAEARNDREDLRRRIDSALYRLLQDPEVDLADRHLECVELRIEDAFLTAAPKVAVRVHCVTIVLVYRRSLEPTRWEQVKSRYREFFASVDLAGGQTDISTEVVDL